MLFALSRSGLRTTLVPGHARFAQTQLTDTHRHCFVEWTKRRHYTCPFCRHEAQEEKEGACCLLLVGFSVLVNLTTSHKEHFM